MAETPSKMYFLATFFTLLAMLAIVLRFYARLIKRTKFSYDDYMILPAMLFTIVTAICMYIGTARGDLARHTAVDDTGYPIFTHRTVVLEQIIYVSQLTQTLTFGFTKLAVLLLYKRIFTGELFKKTVYAGYAMVFIWTIGFFFSMLLQCWPISTNWTGFGGDEYKCVNTNTMLVAHAYTDTFTDVIILAIPIPCIWALQMKVKHKLGVSAIFLLGFLTVGSGAARSYVFHKVEEQTDSGAGDVSYILTPTVYWPLIESSLGIVGACMPLMRPLFTGATSKGFMRRLRKVYIPSLYNDPSTSKGSDTTAVASSEGSSKKHGSSDFKKNPSRAQYIEDNSRGLDPHGLLDEKEFEKELAKDSISCTTEIKVSSEGGLRLDDMV